MPTDLGRTAAGDGEAMVLSPPAREGAGALGLRATRKGVQMGLYGGYIRLYGVHIL